MGAITYTELCIIGCSHKFDGTCVRLYACVNAQVYVGVLIRVLVLNV